MIEKGGGGRQGGIMVEKRREIMVGRGGGGICGLMQRRFEVPLGRVSNMWKED